MYRMDPDMARLTSSDLDFKKANNLAWKELDFLERSNAPEQTGKEHQEKLISQLKQENKDFAAELDKAQMVLQLQGDIEKENRQMNEKDYQQSKLLWDGSNLKLTKLKEKETALAKAVKSLNDKLGIDVEDPYMPSATIPGPR